MPETDPGTLGRIVQQPGQEQLLVAPVPGRTQRRHDVQAMALVGAMHRLEELELGWRQPGGQGRALSVGHATGQVPDELAGLARPPAAH
jgi:hypothetical protein